MFLALYLGLASWFLYAAWRLFTSSSSEFWQYIAAVCSAFLGVFMFKAVFSVRNGRPNDLHEITSAEQPRLFDFLFSLADAAGAPRPHKVYLSNEVNAAVFYDLSLFNLFFPSKKNLVVGLPLVNALNMGELRAVLAHEFGHFAQRSMAVGRWVYVAHQIAAHLVARRDQLEDMLEALSRVDVRIRLVVLVVQLVIWAIRSVVDSTFRLVMVMERALSREMEMQADLVAVSLTGSDALIHALHRLQAADDAWNRSLQFIYGERHEKRRVPDAYLIQSHVTQRMARILSEQYAPVPPVPAEAPGEHRLFRPEMAQPPRMWLTHPLNHEREANAKRHYVQAPIDDAPAWNLFDNVAQLRAAMTEELLGPADGKPVVVEVEESLKALGQVYRREQYSQRYQGIYFGRALTRHASDWTALRDVARPFDPAACASLYPPSLKQAVSQLRTLETQAEQLKAIIAGAMKVEGGTVHLNGESLRKTQLPEALAKIDSEIATLVARLHAHDLDCRSWHRGAAVQVGRGWPEYLDGLLALVDYAEHMEAELRDLHGMLHNTVAIATASGSVNEQKANQIVNAAYQVHQVLELVYNAAPEVQLDERILAKPELAGGWVATLGKFGLPVATREGLGDWLDAAETWVSHVGATLSILRAAALEQLLLAESQMAMALRQPALVADAPAPSAAPKSYPRLLAGSERPRVTSIGWWARFLRADGVAAEAARLLIAVLIVAAVIAGGTSSYMSSGASASGSNDVADNRGRAGGGITAVNGLATTVVVNIDGVEKTIPPRGSAWFDVAAGKHKVATRTMDGRTIETFEDSIAGDSAHAYNVAAAAPLVVWTAVYGKGQKEVPVQVLGAVRWKAASVEHVFSEPPASIQNTGSRRVLDIGAHPNVESYLNNTPDEAQRKAIILQHARYDDPGSADIDTWMALAAEAGTDVLSERLAAQPREVQWLRGEQDRAKGTAAYDGVCARHRQLAAANPDDPDMQYIGLRCGDSASSTAAMLAAAKRWPANPWLLNAAAYEHMVRENWEAAMPELEQLLSAPPQLADPAAMRLARLKRMLGQPQDMVPLERASPRLARLAALEAGYGDQDNPSRSYQALSKGQLALATSLSQHEEGLREHLVRLVGASDGATRDAAQRALALPADQGIDVTSAFAMWGLALRESHDPAAYRSVVARSMPPADMARIDGFVAALAGNPSDPAHAARLDGLVPELRNMAKVLALVQYGKRAPAAWRKEVRGYLFASERPYFM